MKLRKTIAFVLTAALLGGLLTGCFMTTPPDSSSETPLEEAAGTYTPEQAGKEGCLVQQDWIPAPGAEALLEKFMAGERDTLRVANFTAGEEGCQVYEVVRQEEGYLLRSPGEEGKTFKFLRKEDWVQSIPSGGGIPGVGSISTNTSYFLCDRDDVTYLECAMSQTNAQFGTAIPTFTILTRFNGQTQLTPSGSTGGVDQSYEPQIIDPNDIFQAGAAMTEQLVKQGEEILRDCYQKLRDSELAEESAEAMQKLTIQVMELWNETFPDPDKFATVRAWFDALKQEAGELAQRMGLDEMKEKFRAHWLLLQE